MKRMVVVLPYRVEVADQESGTCGEAAEYSGPRSVSGVKGCGPGHHDREPTDLPARVDRLQSPRAWSLALVSVAGTAASRSVAWSVSLPPQSGPRRPAVHQAVLDLAEEEPAHRQTTTEQRDGPPPPAPDGTAYPPPGRHHTTGGRRVIDPVGSLRSDGCGAQAGPAL